MQSRTMSRSVCACLLAVLVMAMEVSAFNTFVVPFGRVGGKTALHRNVRSTSLKVGNFGLERTQPLFMSSAPVEEVDVEAVEIPIDSLYTCPVCQSAIELSDEECGNCGAKFEKLPTSGAVDLVKKEKVQETASESSSSSCSLLNSLQDNLGNNPLLTAGLGSLGVNLPGRPIRQELFRTPQVANAYERGWRASFAGAGFPGIEKEFDLVQDYFQDKRGKTVLDLSCGSGLMVRRLARSNAYEKVIALDFSESMLEEVSRRKREENCPDFDIIRGDVQAMPFKDDALDAIHSGAALHCWPSVEKGLSEVHRTLKPGGRFFATTFLWGIPDEVINLSKSLGLNPVDRAYRFFSVPELEGLMYDAGFDEYSVERRSRCAIIRCRKQPTLEDQAE